MKISEMKKVKNDKFYVRDYSGSGKSYWVYSDSVLYDLLDELEMPIAYEQIYNIKCKFDSYDEYNDLIKRSNYDSRELIDTIVQETDILDYLESKGLNYSYGDCILIKGKTLSSSCFAPSLIINVLTEAQILKQFI